MKRDMDLVRELLLGIEACPDLDGTTELDEYDPETFGIAERSSKEVDYHLLLLVEEGFIRGRTVGADAPTVAGLSWKGCEFLDTIRDGEIWRRTKETAQSAGVASVQALYEIGKSYAKQKLIEHGVHLG